MKKNKLLVFLLAAVSTTAIAAAGCAPEAGGHNHSYSWKSDAENHWEECSCGNKKAAKPHVDAFDNETGADGADGKCDDCGRLNYAVNFVMNGHGTEPATQYVYADGKAVDPGVIANDGDYIFGGWYTDSSLTTEFDFNTPITTATNVYAKWLVTVTFDTHGHGTAPDEQTVKVGGTVTPPTDPDYGADGYVFGGWTLDDSGADDATPYDFSTPVDGPITLYAIWVADERPLVTFNLGGEGNNAVYSLLRVEENDYATKPAVDPDIDGYLFAGWYTVDGDEPFDFENTPIVGDITLYAHWTADERTMFAFDLQGHGDTIPTQKLSEGEKPERPTDPTADGYTFAGWYANPECDGDEYDFDDELTGDTTVYAKWTVTVTFDVQGHGTEPANQTVKDGGLVEDPGNLADEGDYAFGGWYKDANCTDEFDFDSDTVDAATTIYAKWTHVIPSLVLGDDATAVIGDKTELQFQYTASKDGRFKLELASGASERCYFTTDLAEDDGVYYGEDYTLFAKTFDLHKGETVTVTLYRGASITNDNLRLGFYFSQVTDEALPSDGWLSGKYVGNGYTFDFDRDQKEVTYKEWGYTASYLGGSFDYLWFEYEHKAASYLSRKQGNDTIFIDEDGNDLAEQKDVSVRVQTYTITEYYIRETSVGVWELSYRTYSSHYESHGFGSPETSGKLATLNYEEPQREIAVSEFAGTYEGTGFNPGNVGNVTKIVIYEDGSGYLQYGSTKSEYKMGDGGNAFERSDSTLKWGNYYITANLGDDDKVVSINVVDTVSGGGKFVYTRTGDAPVELPSVLPVDDFVNYAGQHFVYLRQGDNYHTAYYYIDNKTPRELSYLGKFDISDYNASTGRYTIDYYVTYGTNLTLQAEVSGSAGNYTIRFYQGGSLYDTLTPIEYHDIVPDEEVTLNTSTDLVLGMAYYYKPTKSGTYTVTLSGAGGNYTGSNDKQTIHLHTQDIYESNIASFECTMGCKHSGDKISVSAGQTIAIHIGESASKPASIKVKFETDGGGSGGGGADTLTQSYMVGFESEVDAYGYIDISGLAAGSYSITIEHDMCMDFGAYFAFAFTNVASGSDEKVNVEFFASESTGTITIPSGAAKLYIYSPTLCRQTVTVTLTKN